MTQTYLDPNSYTFSGGFTVQNKRDLIVPESLVLSQTMLIKWQIRNLAKGATIQQIAPATLTAVLELPGLGQLNSEEYQIDPSIQGRDRVQIITLDPTLPYKLTLTDVDGLVTNSVLEFYSFDFGVPVSNKPSNSSMDTNEIKSAISASSAAEIAAIAASTAAVITASTKPTSVRESVFVQGATTIGATNLYDNTEPRKRLNGYLINAARKATLWVSFSDTVVAVAGHPSTPIKAGEIMYIPEGYTGYIGGIWGLEDGVIDDNPQKGKSFLHEFYPA